MTSIKPVFFSVSVFFAFLMACGNDVASYGQSGGGSGSSAFTSDDTSDHTAGYTATSSSGATDSGHSDSHSGTTDSHSSSTNTTGVGGTGSTSEVSSATTDHFNPCDLCVKDEICVTDDNGTVSCEPVICDSGVTVCMSDQAMHTCSDDGTKFLPPVFCDPDQLCAPSSGICIDACEAIEEHITNKGCEFWAVDMANPPPHSEYPFGVVVTNPNPELPVHVKIHDARTGGEQQITSGLVAPGGSTTFVLSGQSIGMQGYYPNDVGFSLSGIGSGGAFQITGNLPFEATQFNTLDGTMSFTTDSSLLIPAHLLTDKYTHMAWGEGLGSGSSLVVVATSDQKTTIKIIPTANTPVGQNGFPAMTAWIPELFELNQFDYVQLATKFGDLSGTRIEADKPIAVFGGHSCGTVPNKNVEFCDHLEEQALPWELWGHESLAVRGPKRGSEQMTWRILAGPFGAKVTFSPKPIELMEAVVELGANSYITFSTDESFQVSSNSVDRPILVTGYLQGAAATGDPEYLGDPSMYQVIPTKHWKRDYTFPVQADYTKTTAILVRNEDQPIDFKCVEEEGPWNQMNGSYQWAVVNIGGLCANETNWFMSDTPFGLTLVGESFRNSYAHPAGLGGPMW